jgi:hypothetical protein
MPSMRFMSTLDGRPPKMIRFDSSPGLAISRALGDLDEKSYQAELKETMVGGEEVYEVKMRRASTECSPGPHPLTKVGVLHYTKPSTAP